MASSGGAWVACTINEFGQPAYRDHDDLRTAFVARELRGEHFKVRGHWNRLEHAVAAQALSAGLLEARLMPPGH